MGWERGLDREGYFALSPELGETQTDVEGRSPREVRERWLVPGRPTEERQHQCGLTAPLQVESKEKGSQGAGVSEPGGSKAQGTAPRRCRSCKEKLWVRMRLVTSWVRSVSPKMSS